MNTASSKKILSIAIPTFNGAKYIAGAIESIYRQYEPELFSEIEVVVVNNASTDATVEIVAPYLEAGKVRLHTQQKNIGFDRNIISAFNVCNGEYILFLGDDDYLLENSIGALVKAIKNGNYQALLLPVSFLNTRTKKTVFNDKYPASQAFNNVSDFFFVTEFDSSCISSLCFRRALPDSNGIQRNIGSNWIHLAILIELVGKSKQAYSFHQNMVTVRIHNDRWEGNFGNQLLSGLTHLKLIKNYRDDGLVSQIAYEKLASLKYSQTFRAIVGLKPKKLRDQIKCAVILIDLFPAKIGLWLIQLPLLLLPNSIFRILLKIYYFSRKLIRLCFPAN